MLAHRELVVERDELLLTIVEGVAELDQRAHRGGDDLVVVSRRGELCQVTHLGEQPPRDRGSVDDVDAQVRPPTNDAVAIDARERRHLRGRKGARAVDVVVDELDHRVRVERAVAEELGELALRDAANPPVERFTARALPGRVVFGCGVRDGRPRHGSSSQDAPAAS